MNKNNRKRTLLNIKSPDYFQIDPLKKVIDPHLREIGKSGGEE